MNFGLYVIMTNPVLPYVTVAEICVKQKIRYLQLREKDIDDRTFEHISRDIMSITKNSETKFIINDRHNVCKILEADGLHLGQDDLSIENAREFLAKQTIFGLSTHNLEQVKIALTKKPDYIGFGPIYKTPTKKIPDPVVGCEQISKIVQMSPIPVVAIGGIDENNLPEVLQAGAKNFCMVRDLMTCKNLEDKIKRIREIYYDSMD